MCGTFHGILFKPLLHQILYRVGNPYPTPIYIAGTNLDVHVHNFRKAIQVNGEKKDVDIVNLF
jgi:hypothetical protein